MSELTVQAKDLDTGDNIVGLGTVTRLRMIFGGDEVTVDTTDADGFNDRTVFDADKYLTVVRTT